MTKESERLNRTRRTLEKRKEFILDLRAGGRATTWDLELLQAINHALELVAEEHKRLFGDSL